MYTGEIAPLAELVLIDIQIWANLNTCWLFGKSRGGVIDLKLRVESFLYHVVYTNLSRFVVEEDEEGERLLADFNLNLRDPSIVEYLAQ